MSDGTVAGLQTKKDREAQPNINKPSYTHSEIENNQETIHRDAKGRKINMDTQKAQQIIQKREQTERDEQRMKWGRGIVQVEEQERLAQRLLNEKGKQLAVFGDDIERNDIMKEKVHWGDAMANTFKRSTKDAKSRRVYQGACPANRFNIKPGYRWDGIDRSNGWEIKLFRSKNLDNLDKKEYHRWATEDM
jgi:pre-mRNA-splicing factor CWC26